MFLNQDFQLFTLVLGWFSYLHNKYWSNHLEDLDDANTANLCICPQEQHRYQHDNMMWMMIFENVFLIRRC